MNGLDWIIFGILFFSILLARCKGSFTKFFRWRALSSGTCWRHGDIDQIAPWFLPYVKNEWVANSVAFFLIFLAVVLIAGIIARDCALR